MKYSIVNQNEYAEIINLLYGTTQDRLMFVDNNKFNLKTSNVIVV